MKHLLTILMLLGVSVVYADGMFDGKPNWQYEYAGDFEQYIADGSNGLRSASYSFWIDGELILYDFTMKKGDELPSRDGSKLTVKEVTERKDNAGNSRTVIVLSNGVEIMEGIGCTSGAGLFAAWLNPVVSPIQGGITYGALIRLEKGGTVVYEKSWDESRKEYAEYLQATDITRIEEASAIDDAPVYDITGRRIAGKPENGIYIKGGKKYVTM